MAARQALAQMDPGIAGLDAIFTDAVRRARLIVGFRQMFTVLHLVSPMDGFAMGSRI
jgi:hypothetical protein